MGKNYSQKEKDSIENLQRIKDSIDNVLDIASTLRIYGLIDFNIYDSVTAPIWDTLRVLKKIPPILFENERHKNIVSKSRKFDINVITKKMLLK